MLIRKMNLKIRKKLLRGSRAKPDHNQAQPASGSPIGTNRPTKPLSRCSEQAVQDV
jgi:hypothetical protein